MKNVIIVRREHVPLAPAPFFANGAPSWFAALSEAQYRALPKVWEHPTKRFLRDVVGVWVNGERVWSSLDTPSDRTKNR